ncbi:MAG TPA: SusC/RagA family TonB-linked outer membrane protein, partial [Arachidicoccus sp.]|nr:SusC/RagA family TonB-linked outer membrane protein [Arachidicoccus sp.]
SEKSMLDEVVVIGYGKQSRETVTGAISKISEKEFDHAPAANPLVQLQGKVPGLSLQISDGQPGANPQIFIRGGSSTSAEGDAPLFIVDGFVGAIRNMSDLNPDDIESVQVLKDAASMAIYGARAANGIIIVKTKSGKLGSPKISFKVTSGVEQMAKKYDFVSAADYIRVSRENINLYSTPANKLKYLEGGTYGMSTGNPRNTRNTLEFLDVYLLNYGQKYVDYLLNQAGWETMTDPVTGRQLIFKSTDFQDVTFQTGLKKEYDFSVSGGSDRFNYYLGMGYINQDGILYGSWYKNYTVDLKVNYKLNDWVSFNTQVGYIHRNSDGASSYNNTLSRSVTMPFTERLYYEDGTPAPGEINASFRSRLHEVYYKDQYSDNNVYRTNLQIGAEMKLIPGLTFSPTMYYYSGTSDQNRFEAYNEINKNRNASANREMIKNLQLDGLLNYTKSIGQHNIAAILGTSYLDQHTNSMSGSGYGAPTDNIPTLNASNPETQRVSTEMSEDNMMSYFGRINYNYALKYILSASLRSDGSSKFSTEHKWGLFPGFSAGWNVNKEKFWKELAPAFFTQLKIRGSWGETGNNELSIGNSQGAYSTGEAYTYQGQAGILNTAVANRTLRWETTTSSDLGLDMGFFDNRVSLMVDYYSKVTSDRLYDKPLDYSTGFSSIKSNFGSIRSRGVEFELSADIFRGKNFQWNTSFNLAYNKSIVLDLPENGQDKNRSGGNIIFDPVQQKDIWVGGFAQGEKYGGRWAYHMIGVYSTDADALNAPYDVFANGRQKKGGDAIWEDVNGDNIIDNKDMVFMGYIRPDITGGMVNSFTYKGFNLRFVMDYALGFVIDNGFRAKANGSSRNNNMALTDILGPDIWKKPGDIATIPRYTVESDWDFGYRNHVRDAQGIGNSGSNPSNNSLYYKKGDYLAFREVSISYDWTAKFLKKIAIRQLQIFGGVYNLGYLTGYDGLTPEVFTGNDPGLYPRPREYNFGVKIIF